MNLLVFFSSDLSMERLQLFFIITISLIIIGIMIIIKRSHPVFILKRKKKNKFIQEDLYY